MATLTHQFVDLVPRDLEDGVLYISMTYRAAVHRCACGCGTKVATPFSPAQWQMAFNGESVSLMPSIGNWQFPCQSHYWITNNSVRWARSMSQAQIGRGLRLDAADLDAQIAARASGADPNVSQSLFSRAWRRLWSRRSS